MVFFLNSKVKTHTEDALQYIFDENKEKIVILGYSIVSRRSPQQQNIKTFSIIHLTYKFWKIWMIEQLKIIIFKNFESTNDTLL